MHDKEQLKKTAVHIGFVNYFAWLLCMDTLQKINLKVDKIHFYSLSFWWFWKRVLHVLNIMGEICSYYQTRLLDISNVTTPTIFNYLGNLPRHDGSWSKKGSAWLSVMLMDPKKDLKSLKKRRKKANNELNVRVLPRKQELLPFC